MTDFPAAQPHGPVETLTDSIFFVRGSMKMNPVMRIGRNMTVVRHGPELTVLNAVRLNEQGERELEALGEVKHVMRLSHFHGLDDPYYVSRYGARFWAPEGCGDPAPKVDEVITAESEPPFPDASFFLFEHTRHPEAVIHLRAGGSLLFCDAVQHYPDLSGNSPLAKLLMVLKGFKGAANIGPIWRQVTEPRGGSLRPDFDRLLALPFERLLGAHGSPLTEGAHDALAATVRRIYG